MLINDYLKENDISKYQLSKICNLPYGTLNDICNGKTDIANCTAETLYKIANAIGCSVDDIVNERFAKSSKLEKIKALITPIAEKYELNSVYLFGSYARGDEDENSDIDVLIDREGSKIHGIFMMNALLNEMKLALKKDVDLITLQSLKQKSTLNQSPVFVDNVIKERIKIYGKSW